MKNSIKSFLEKEGNLIDKITDTSIADTSYALGENLLKPEKRISKLEDQLKISSYFYFKGFYKGVPVWETEFCSNGEAITLPPLGIFMTPNAYNNDKDILYHEYGHILQSYLLGSITRYYFVIGINSVISTQIANKHQESWTEKTANQLSYWIKGKPLTWNFNDFPVYFR